MYLETIKEVNDIKKIDPKDYPALAQEIRDFLIRKISVTGGHLGSNLGHHDEKCNNGNFPNEPAPTEFL